jgi:exodeoxyribonuclease VII small subunit
MSETQPSFEESLAELARVVQILERGQPTLEEGLAEFEKGVRLLHRCRSLLESADRRIQELVDIDEQGRATLKPFAHQSTLEKDAPPAKRVRKVAKEPPPAEERDPGLFGS